MVSLLPTYHYNAKLDLDNVDIFSLNKLIIRLKFIFLFRGCSITKIWVPPEHNYRPIGFNSKDNLLKLVSSYHWF